MAINPNSHGRTKEELNDLCDVCYWRTIAESKLPMGIYKYLYWRATTCDDDEARDLLCDHGYCDSDTGDLVGYEDVK